MIKIAQDANIKIGVKLDPKNNLKSEIDKLIKQVQNNKIKITVDTKSLQKVISDTKVLKNEFKTVKFGNGKIDAEINKTRASIEKLGGSIKSVNKTTDHTGKITSATIQWTDSTNKLQTSYYKLNSTLKEVDGEMRKVESWNKSSQKQVEGVSKLSAEYDKLQKKLVTMQAAYNKNLSSTGMQENIQLLGRYSSIQTQINSLKQKGASATTEELNALKKLVAETERLSKENQELNNIQKKIVALQKQYDKNVNSTGASKDVQVAKELENVLQKINSLKQKGSSLTQKEQNELRECVQHATKLTQEAMESNNAFKQANASITKNTNSLRQQRTLTNQMSSDIRSYMSTWLSVTAVITSGVMQIRKAVEATIAMNSAMTQVKMVTNEGGEAYDRLGESATDMAVKSGKSSEEALQSVKDWVKAGQTMEESIVLAETSLMGSLLSEQSVSDISTQLIAPIKAWGLEVNKSTELLDKMNFAANSHAVSVADIGSAYSKSSSVMAMYGNSLEETTALIVAAENATKMGGDVIGTSLRAIAQRLIASRLI